MDLIQSNNHISNSEVKTMSMYSSTPFLLVCKRESDLSHFQRIKMVENLYLSQLSNICLMDKNMSFSKSNWIVHISQINKAISILLLLSSTDTSISQQKSPWMKTKSLKSLTTNTFCHSIQLNRKLPLTSLKKYCTYFFYSRKHDKDGEPKGINTVVFKKSDT